MAASTKGDDAVGRRGFLGAVASLSAAAAALVAPGSVGEARAETEEERTKGRYAETDHVKRYYETNRY